MLGVFTEQSKFITYMLEGGLLYYILVIVYLLVASYTVLNMLIGVMCEVIADVANREREDILIQELRYRIGQFESVFASGTDEETKVTPEALKGLLRRPEACKILNQIGVDVLALVDLENFIFPEGREIELTKFMEKILQFRGSNAATVKDIVDLRKYVFFQLKEQLSDRISAVERQLSPHDH